MPKLYFIKQGFSRPFNDAKGRPFPFTPIGDDQGAIEVDTDLQKDWAIQLKGVSGRLGILEVTKEQMEEIKKNASEKSLRKVSRPEIRASRAEFQHSDRSTVRESAVVESDPVEIPKEVPQPKRRGRPPKVLTESLAPVAQSAKDVPPIDPDPNPEPEV